MIEVWEDIEGYQGKYQVSTYGRVRSASKVLKTRLNYNGNYKNKEDCRTLRPRVDLIDDCGKRKSHYVSSLVANAFIMECKYPHATVNHIDGDSTNNRVDNLQVMTLSKNQKYSLYYGLPRSERNFGEQSKMKKQYQGGSK